jgi:predicted glycogen debranching enzyme
VTRPLLTIEREALLQLERSMTREWLLTDGLGGYASSTVLMCPARRYHGLLVAPLPDSVERHVFLGRFEEWFHGGGKSFAISMGRYPGTYGPLGHQGIERFELAPVPRWTYRFGHAVLEREVLLASGAHTVLVRYRVTGQQNPVVLRLRPLLPYRRAGALTFENYELDKRVERIANGIVVRPYASLPELAITASAQATFEVDPLWYKNIEYPAELARGYEGHEECFSPGEFHFPLTSGADLVVAATLGPAVADPARLWSREHPRRGEAAARVDETVRSRIAHGADDFLFRTRTGRLAVDAGWPWFGEWGRDSCIALPGLLLARGRVDECVEALEGMAEYLKDGLVPNVFGNGRADSDYGSVDASLWFARAVRLTELASPDPAAIGRRFLPALREIAEGYARGAGLGLAVDGAGLLRSGSPLLNSTWMDARVDGVPVTPRDGCAVEINALWYFLLAYLEHLEQRGGDDVRARVLRATRERAGAAFLERFWIPSAGYLADVWKDGARDEAIRPNMVIAASLEWSPLTRAMRGEVLRCARAELLTAAGLRTLDPRDPRYQGTYGGGPEQRDRAYHQGTVWPWLVGPFAEAWLRGFGGGEDEKRFLRELLDGFGAQLENQGLMHVSEVMSGDPPHSPGGTIAQAWNTGELLRAYDLVERWPA